MDTAPVHVMLPVEDYLPADYEGLRDPAMRLFNPSILPLGDGYVAVYRVVTPGSDRRIAGCRLGPDFAPVPGSQVDISGLLAPKMAGRSERSREWFADPRIFALGDTLQMSWNDGFHYGPDDISPFNNQYLVELDRETLRPMGPVRAMVRDDGQHRPEKNWMLFDTPQGWRCVYEIGPHRIMEPIEKTDETIVWRETRVAPNLSPYGETFGEFRGGAGPVEHGGAMYHFAHSAYAREGLRHYVVNVYTFAPHAPYPVKRTVAEPFALPRPDVMPDLKTLNENAGEVLYVTGAVSRGEDWVLAYGVDDKIGCIVRVPKAEIERRLTFRNDPSALSGLIAQAKLPVRRYLNRRKAAKARRKHAAGG